VRPPLLECNVKHSFDVSGMTCGHCEKAVSRALRQLDPDAEVAVDRSSGRVTVESAQDRTRLASAITAEGYTVAPESAPPQR
jgi:copper chaperone